MSASWPWPAQCEAWLAAVLAESARDPERCFFPDQNNNPANALAHHQTTAEAILSQTGGSLTRFVSAMGTSGTFMGAAKRLGEAAPAAWRIAVQPDSPLHAIVEELACNLQKQIRLAYGRQDPGKDHDR